MAADLGLTHVALPVTDADTTAAFYTRYGGLQVVLRRAADPGAGVDAMVWLSDLTRPFVVVVAEARQERDGDPTVSVGRR